MGFMDKMKDAAARTVAGAQQPVAPAPAGAGAARPDANPSLAAPDPNAPLYDFESHIAGKNAHVLIFPDRLDWSRKRGVSAGKVTAGILTGGASLLVTGLGKGGYTAGRTSSTETVPIVAITAVSTRRDGPINTVVAVSTPSGVVEMRVHHDQAEKVRSIINQLVARAHQTSAPVVVQMPMAPTPAPSAPAAAPDLGAQLQQLAGLRDAGILTDEEFSAKKAEILSRY